MRGRRTSADGLVLRICIGAAIFVALMLITGVIKAP